MVHLNIRNNCGFISGSAGDPLGTLQDDCTACWKAALATLGYRENATHPNTPALCTSQGSRKLHNSLFWSRYLGRVDLIYQANVLVDEFWLADIVHHIFCSIFVKNCYV